MKSYIIISFFSLITKISAIDLIKDAYQTEPTDAHQTLLNIPLDSLYYFPDSNNGLLASENCTLAFEIFSESAINFTRCSLKFARPIHVCMECGAQHNVTLEAYKSLKQQGSKCKEFYFSSDQLDIIDLIYNSQNLLWQNSYCQNCYDYYAETEVFFLASNNLMNCIENTNKSEVLTTNSTCVKCNLEYANVSYSYNRFVQWKKEFDGGICMDIVDTMNISRRIWSELECSVNFNTNIGFPNVLTALTVGAMPVMFYLLAKNISRLDDIKIVRPKRKLATVQPPSNHLESVPES